MASESARSPVTASASSSVARSLSSGPRAKRARWYPRCARRRAQAAPIPLLAAVTIATCDEGMDGNLEAVHSLRDRDKPRQDVVTITFRSLRNGAVGLHRWISLTIGMYKSPHLVRG